ncbi:MAG TPA: LEA type 2 family protein [Candidatus Omnitrophota bacterium]|nr:LEA type 2 family protein [Candidatus Omnitrophota bacterium]
MKKLSALVMLFAAALLVAGCLELQPPQVTHKDTQVSVLSFSELLAKSNFEVKNPNPIGLRGAVEYQITVDGKPFTSGVTSTIEMSANGQTSFIVESKIDLVQLFGTVSDVAKIIGEGKTSIPYSISGKFKSDIVGIPVEAPVSASGTLPLPKLSDIKIKF